MSLDLTKFTITKHASKRLEERTSIEVQALDKILEFRKYVWLGVLKNSKRQYKLFYLPQDTKYFVIVENYFTDSVITVLPLRFFESVAFKIPEQKLTKAKKLGVQLFPSLIESFPEVKKTTKSFSITAVLSNGRQTIRKQIGNYSFEEYPETIDQAVSQPALIYFLRNKLLEKKIKLNMIVEIILSSRRETKFYIIPFTQLDKLLNEQK